MRRLPVLFSCCVLSSCGGQAGTVDADRSVVDGGTVDGAPGLDGPAPDGRATDGLTPGPDGGGTDSSRCVPGGPQCSDCEDNDNDGLVDGFDPQCSSAADRDEGSFSTGIPGDNQDGTWQDCFFDGNSGSGDDGCRVHTCCLVTDCPPKLAGSYDSGSCTVAQQCIDFCLGAAPPCCDCFGCCTICDATGCYTIMTNPAVAPQCTQATIANPSLCPTCDIDPNCSRPVDPCMLCPGQTELPPECSAAECPPDIAPCKTTADCLAGEYCANGCCVAQIILG
ncbi:MAG: hypothetical protein V2A73_20455 [Pseudomonadota bacterium]